MKLKTKEEKKLLKWSNSLPPITERQKKYAFKHCLEHLVLESQKHCYCTECGHDWTYKKGSYRLEKRDLIAKCPHCGKEHKVLHNKRQYSDRTYFCVVSTKEHYQYIRWYMIRRTVSKQRYEHKFWTVGIEWINEKGRRFTFERNRAFYGYCIDLWSYCPKLEQRKKSTFARWLSPSATFYQSILPILKRNGWKRDHKFADMESIFMQKLLSDPHFESWYKIGHRAVCISYVVNICMTMRRTANYVFSEEHKRLIKLANRNNVIFDTIDKWNNFLNYIEELKECGQDIYNPKISFPKDFQAAHHLWHQRAQKRRAERQRIEDERRNRERAIIKCKQNEKKAKWIAEYAQRFKDMYITDNGFTIKPLITMEDFEKEHEHMHHCIVTYYGKFDTLLLSIEHDNKKYETAEISLLNGQIVQCRGVNNQPSQFHDDIVTMLKSYMKEFIQRYNKKLVTLPVLASHYKIAV